MLVPTPSGWTKPLVGPGWLLPPSEFQERSFSEHCGLGHCSQGTAVPGSGSAGQIQDSTWRILMGPVLAVSLSSSPSISAWGLGQGQGEMGRPGTVGSSRAMTQAASGPGPSWWKAGLRDQECAVPLVARGLGLLIHQYVSLTFDRIGLQRAKNVLKNPWTSPHHIEQGPGPERDRALPWSHDLREAELGQECGGSHPRWHPALLLPHLACLSWCLRQGLCYVCR